MTGKARQEKSQTVDGQSACHVRDCVLPTWQPRGIDLGKSEAPRAQRSLGMLGKLTASSHTYVNARSCHSRNLVANLLTGSGDMVQTSSVVQKPASNGAESCQRIFLARHGERADLADKKWLASEAVSQVNLRILMPKLYLSIRCQTRLGIGRGTGEACLWICNRNSPGNCCRGKSCHRQPRLSSASICIERVKAGACVKLKLETRAEVDK